MKLTKVPLAHIRRLGDLEGMPVGAIRQEHIGSLVGRQLYLIVHEGADFGEGSEYFGHTVQMEPPVNADGEVTTRGSLHPYRGSYSIALGLHRVVGYSRTHLHLEPTADEQEEEA